MQAHRPVSSRGSSRFVVYLVPLSCLLHAGLVIAGSAFRIPGTDIKWSEAWFTLKANPADVLVSRRLVCKSPAPTA